MKSKTVERLIKSTNESIIQIVDDYALRIVNGYYLFLDDQRAPEDVFEYTKHDRYVKKEWVIVRNFEQFKTTIETMGVPKFISFDHDLAPEHYVPERYWGDYELSQTYQEMQSYQEKTGYDCALWLWKYCRDNDLLYPNAHCHSMNPVGADKINRLILYGNCINF